MAAARCALLFFASLCLLQAAMGADEDALNDFCVADLASPVKVNGIACKPDASVTGNDFKFSLVPATPGGRFGLGLSPAFVGQFPGLNTQGISAALLTFAVGGQTPPHTHNRATELLYVIEGTLKVGFVANSNVLYQTTVTKGDLFVFPRGLVHFQQNIGATPAVAFASLNSQNPGAQLVASALLAATPVPIDDATLGQSLGVPVKTVKNLRKAFLKV